MVLTEKLLLEILNYLDDSITNLANDSLNNSEFHMEKIDFKQFLSDQYDIRLNNMLDRKNINIHHLESGLKNKIIQRKQNLINKITKI